VDIKRSTTFLELSLPRKFKCFMVVDEDEWLKFGQIDYLGHYDIHRCHSSSTKAGKERVQEYVWHDGL
jgi:hypothetical protein